MNEDVVKVDCRFDLTDAEIAAAAKRRGLLEAELAALESAFGVEKEKHKNAVAKLDGAAGALGDLIRKGYELRPTDCRVEFAYEAGEVRTVRLDTGETVKSRPMTEGEKGKGPRLPLGPAVLLDDSDPDAQAARAAENAGQNGDAGGIAQPNIPANNAEAVKQSEGADAAAEAPTESNVDGAPVNEQSSDDLAGAAAPASEEAAPADDVVHELMHGTTDRPAFNTALTRATRPQLEQAFGYGALSRSAKRAIKAEMALRGIKPVATTPAKPAKDETEQKPEAPPEPEPEAAPSEPTASQACSVCKCDGYVGSAQYPGTCRTCGHLKEYHQGRGVTVDPLGLAGYPKAEKAEAEL